MYKKYLYSEERDKYLRTIKRAVLNGEEIEVPAEYRYLVDEWQRSAELGVPYDLEYLPESTRDLRVFERITDYDKFRLAYLNDYYTRRDEVLGALGCAVFYTYDDLAVYRKAGNAQVLDDLRAHGLRLGSKLSEENVGICAANIADQFNNQIICRMGSENYLEMFSKYAFFVYFWAEEERNVKGVLIAATPVENCSDIVQNAVEFLLTVEGYTHEIYYPFTKKRADFLEAAANNSESMELFLDEHGEVVFASRSFQETFGKKLVPGPPPGISQFVPELSYLTRFLDVDRNPCQTREILLLNAEKKNGLFIAIPELIYAANGTKGIRCVLQYSGKKKSPPTVIPGSGAKLQYDFSSIIGESAAMQRLKEYAARAAKTSSNVLILGESGTGKELFAQAIHAASEKSKGPFVPINCAALPKDLLNSELFGYEEGAFTGAMKGGAPGKFEQANGGTIFLDEIGDMPLEMQSALLRVLEDNTVIRVGGKKYIPVDIRVIAATNQDIWKNVQKGSFRADLYFRLNIVTVKIPPLRERPEDIPLLVDNLLERICGKFGIRKCEMAPELIELLQGYAWPGNVRELRNVVERCLNYSSSGYIGLDQLPEELKNTLRGDRPEYAEPQRAARVELLNKDDWRGYDRDRVIELMRKNGGNKTKVAKELGISRATFYKRLKEFGIE